MLFTWMWHRDMGHEFFVCTRAQFIAPLHVQTERNSEPAVLPALSPQRWKDSRFVRWQTDSHGKAFFLSSNALTTTVEDKKNARVRARGHTPRASLASPFRGKGRRCDGAATRETLGTLRRGRFPRRSAYSVVQVLLVAPGIWMCVRRTGEAPERDGDNQRRTRKSEMCSYGLTIQ